MRVECDFAGAMSTDNSSTSHRLSFEDTNHRERLGWREIVVAPVAGVAVFNSSAFGNAVTNELRAYPQDMLAAPLDERTAQLSWTTGAVPADAVALRTRDGHSVAQSRDQLAELNCKLKLTPKLRSSVCLLLPRLALCTRFPRSWQNGCGSYPCRFAGARRVMQPSWD